MAILNVTEYSQLGAGPLGENILAPEEPGTDQTPVDFSGGEAQSAAFGANTRLVRLHTDAACHILFGADPEATTSNQRLAAGQTEYKAVKPGSALKVSVIASS